MHEVVGEVASSLDAARPRYLMGVGTPRDLVVAIGAGVDMFDCVLPHAERAQRAGAPPARTGGHQAGPLPRRPLAARPDLRLSHLLGRLLPGLPPPPLHRREILVLRLFTEHNLHLYGRLVAEARRAIAAGTYASFARDWAGAGSGDT